MTAPPGRTRRTALVVLATLVAVVLPAADPSPRGAVAQTPPASNGDPCTDQSGREGRLDQLAHPTGHTALVVGGPGAGGEEVAAVEAAVAAVADPALVPAVSVAACADHPGHRWARIGQHTSADLGVEGVAVLALRPDGHIGLVAGQDHAGALSAYQRLVAPHPVGARPTTPGPARSR